MKKKVVIVGAEDEFLIQLATMLQKKTIALSTIDQYDKYIKGDLFIILRPWELGSAIMAKLIKKDNENAVVVMIDNEGYLEKETIKEYINNYRLDGFYNDVTDLKRIVDNLSIFLDEEYISKRNLKKSSEQIIKEILRKFEVFPSSMGYQYTNQAILIMVELCQDMPLHEIKVTKDVYPEVVKRLNKKFKLNKTKVFSVEAGIRHIISKIYCNPNNMETIQNLMNKEKNDKPSNSKFLTLITDSIINGWYIDILR